MRDTAFYALPVYERCETNAKKMDFSSFFPDFASLFDSRFCRFSVYTELISVVQSVSIRTSFRNARAHRERADEHPQRHGRDEVAHRHRPGAEEREVAQR